MMEILVWIILIALAVALLMEINNKKMSNARNPTASSALADFRIRISGMRWKPLLK